MYDVLILGGGPAGYTAALYCARAGLSCAVVEGQSAGGQMAITPRIENYPGLPGTDGYTLALRMREQAEAFGARTLEDLATEVSLRGKVKTVRTLGDSYCARALIIASGASPRKLGLPGEDTLTGRGVSYCATCDGAFFRGKKVAVVGGGNTAVSDLLVLAKYCAEVHLIHRRDSLRAARAGQDALRGLANLHLHWNCAVRELLYDSFLQGVLLEDLQSGAKERLSLDGLFVAIGRKPETYLFRGQLEMDDGGYLLADETTKTSVPGVFAAGDVRTKPVRQIVTAVADGAVSALAAESYLADGRSF